MQRPFRSFTFWGLIRCAGFLVLLYSCTKEPVSTPEPVPFAWYVWDVEGNVYPAKMIGAQFWSASNLRVRHFRNGDSIPLVSSKEFWANTTGPACCYYNNDPATEPEYGLLYNFAAVSDTREICPPGWHVPTIYEWETLIDTLGGSAVAGQKLKEIGNTHWAKPNSGASDSTGFSGIPGGYRSVWGDFGSRKYYGYYWSSTRAFDASAFYYYLSYDTRDVCRCYGNSDFAGFSIRMIHD